MPKPKHECGHCHKLFASPTDHMIHIVKEHDRGFVQPDDRTPLRPASCWMCASDIWPNEEGRHICSCGFDLTEARSDLQTS